MWARELSDALVGSLASGLAQATQEALAGQEAGAVAIVSFLTDRVAAAVARAVERRLGGSWEVHVVGEAPGRLPGDRAVELRERKDVRLLLFIPPQVQAAGLQGVRDVALQLEAVPLFKAARAALEGRLSEERRGAVRDAVRTVRRHPRLWRDEETFERRACVYMAAVTAGENPGRALWRLGLWPDRGADWTERLGVNARAAEAVAPRLRTGIASLLVRLQEAGFEPGEKLHKIVAILERFEQAIDWLDVGGRGLVEALEAAGLTFECWPIAALGGELEAVELRPFRQRTKRGWRLWKASGLELEGGTGELVYRLGRKGARPLRINWRPRPFGAGAGVWYTVRVEPVLSQDDACFIEVHVRHRPRKKADGWQATAIDPERLRVELGDRTSVTARVHVIAEVAKNDGTVDAFEDASEPFLVTLAQEEADSASTGRAIPARCIGEARWLGGREAWHVVTGGAGGLEVHLESGRRFALYGSPQIAHMARQAHAEQAMPVFRAPVPAGAQVQLEPLDDLAWDEVPEEVLDTRARFLEALEEWQQDGPDEERTLALAEVRKRYLDAWLAASSGARPTLARTLLALDTVWLHRDGEVIGVVALDTHPVRAAWLARYEELLERWRTTPQGVVLAGRPRALRKLLQAIEGSMVPPWLVVPSGLWAVDASLFALVSSTAGAALGIPTGAEHAEMALHNLRRALGLRAGSERAGGWSWAARRVVDEGMWARALLRVGVAGDPKGAALAMALKEADDAWKGEGTKPNGEHDACAPPPKLDLWIVGPAEVPQDTVFDVDRDGEIRESAARDAAEEVRASRSSAASNWVRPSVLVHRVATPSDLPSLDVFLDFRHATIYADVRDVRGRVRPPAGLVPMLRGYGEGSAWYTWAPPWVEPPADSPWYPLARCFNAGLRLAATALVVEGSGEAGDVTLVPAVGVSMRDDVLPDLEAVLQRTTWYACFAPWVPVAGESHLARYLEHQRGAVVEVSPHHHGGRGAWLVATAHRAQVRAVLEDKLEAWGVDRAVAGALVDVGSAVAGATLLRVRCGDDDAVVLTCLLGALIVTEPKAPDPSWWLAAREVAENVPASLLAFALSLGREGRELVVTPYAAPFHTFSDAWADTGELDAFLEKLMDEASASTGPDSVGMVTALRAGAYRAALRAIVSGDLPLTESDLDAILVAPILVRDVVEVSLEECLAKLRAGRFHPSSDSTSRPAEGGGLHGDGGRPVQATGPVQGETENAGEHSVDDPAEEQSAIRRGDSSVAPVNGPAPRDERHSSEGVPRAPVGDGQHGIAVAPPYGGRVRAGGTPESGREPDEGGPQRTGVVHTERGPGGHRKEEREPKEAGEPRRPGDVLPEHVDMVVGNDARGNPYTIALRTDASPHVAVIGMTGTGKTTLLLHWFLDVASSGAQPLAFDFHGDFGQDAQGVLPRTQVLVPHRMPVDPFAIPDPEENARGLPLYKRVAADIANHFATVFRLGEVQHATLRKVIGAAYEAHGHRERSPRGNPTFAEIVRRLESVGQREVAARLSVFVDYEVFAPRGAPSVESLFGAPTVVDLATLQGDQLLQTAVVA